MCALSANFSGQARIPGYGIPTYVIHTFAKEVSADLVFVKEACEQNEPCLRLLRKQSP